VHGCKTSIIFILFLILFFWGFLSNLFNIFTKDIRTCILNYAMQVESEVATKVIYLSFFLIFGMGLLAYIVTRYVG
jgi:hypothetical protein